jgi:hypothetical protein
METTSRWGPCQHAPAELLDVARPGVCGVDADGGLCFHPQPVVVMLFVTLVQVSCRQ